MQQSHNCDDVCLTSIAGISWLNINLLKICNSISDCYKNSYFCYFKNSSDVTRVLERGHTSCKALHFTYYLYTEHDFLVLTCQFSINTFQNFSDASQHTHTMLIGGYDGVHLPQSPWIWLVKKNYRDKQKETWWYVGVVCQDLEWRRWVNQHHWWQLQQLQLHVLTLMQVMPVLLQCTWCH